MKVQPRRPLDETSAGGPADSTQLDLKPQGIGMAVAFDWGLVVQMLATPFLPLFFARTGIFSFLKLSPALTSIVLFVISLPFAALLAIFGEGVRRGWSWTRPVQVVANALLFLVGIAMVPNVWLSSKAGNYWPVVTDVILLIFSPLIAWRLSRPTTKRWFASVSSVEARKRHGGAWPWLIAIWSIVGGILQAIAAFSR